MLTDIEIKKLMQKQEEESYQGRFNRLKFLLGLGEIDSFSVSILANEYFEEARLCWYFGAFTATIIMAQLAF